MSALISEYSDTISLFTSLVTSNGTVHSLVGDRALDVECALADGAVLVLLRPIRDARVAETVATSEAVGE